MLPEKTFEGRVGIITGGATGIGFAIAREVTRLGARVVIASRKEENLQKAVEQIRSETGRADAAHYHVLDVRDAEAVEGMAAKVDADHGRIDFLLNNAAGNFIVPAEQLSVNGWNSVIGIVLNGTFYCSSAVGKRMIEKKSGGVMLNVIANYAWTGGPGVIHSASAKAGVLALTRTLAVEWARYKIRVNAIAPGPVHTSGASERLFPSEEIAEGIRKTIPLRRFATLLEIAQAASYMLSDYSSYMTGENFVLDGGQWLSGADYFTRLKQMMPSPR
ncbi:MAG TPA: 2,4-dienoyl-CoA reductase [Thermoanaerobaculia bacterium]|jgi:NAD(P)-dependent dehydrogenase (short-subunit alcohol dehydrogenase family)|nr:2,4-dienoyl-CoA reductase [Thermoanaerobaculia bacterium]